MAEAPESRPKGLLYYDPNPTTTKLASAGLRLAGYQVFTAEGGEEAVEALRRHGPGGDNTIHLIVLDASISPETSASLLRELVQVPGAADLPGLLLVSRNAPAPIPGAEALPTLKRPFTTPALVRAVRDALADEAAIGAADLPAAAPLARHLASVLEGAGVLVDDAVLDQVVRDVTAAVPSAPAALVADLEVTPLEAVLALLAETKRRGVLDVRAGDARGRLHVDDGRILHGNVDGVSEDITLGRFIVEGGFLSEDALAGFLGEGQKLPLGLRLVRAGVLSESDLCQVLTAQAREITCLLLSFSRGTATFQPTKTLDPLAEAARASRAQLRISDALLDGLRRRDEEASMGDEVAAVDDVYLRVDENLARLGRHAFTQEELAVLELLNGRNAVKDVARKTRTGTFHVARILYRLSRANVARKRRPPLAV